MSPGVTANKQVSSGCQHIVMVDGAVASAAEMLVAFVALP